MARVDFVDLELHGSNNQAIGFVEGFRIAAGASSPVWYSRLEPVDLGVVEGLRVKARVDAHVILVRELAEAVVDALSRSEVVKLRVASQLAIEHAELAFEFCVYSREDGARARGVVEVDLPAEVQLEGYWVREDASEDARGVELYSPVHHYTIRGGGRYVGTVPAIFDLAHRLQDQDFIRPSKIKLHYRS